jgi:hypothetical protein
MLSEAGLARIVELPLDSPLPCIVIPHVHPGYFIRTDMSRALRQVASLSWVASWVHMYVAVQLLQTPLSSGSRKVLCEAIVEKAEKVQREAGFYDLLLDAAKLASAVKKPIRLSDYTPRVPILEDPTKSSRRRRLLEWYLTTATTMKAAQGPVNDESPLVQLTQHHSDIGKQAMKIFQGISRQPVLQFLSPLDKTLSIAVMERCGRARGDRHSEDRAKQAQELYDAGISRFYQCQSWDLWNKLILDQPQNSWLAGCLQSRKGTVNIRPSEEALIARGRDGTLIQHGTPEDWDGAMQAAIGKLMVEQRDWLRRQSQKGISRKLPLIPIAQLNGSKVDINQHGDLGLRARSLDGDEYPVFIFVGELAAPVHSDDFRTIHFTPHGVEIRNPQGTILCSRSNDLSATSEAPTFQISRLRSLERGKKLLSIWKLITGAVSRDPGILMAPGAVAKGNPIPKRVPDDLESIPPLAIGDALWLLDQYLDVHFPDGGELWLGDKEHFPKGNDDVERFTK